MEKIAVGPEARGVIDLRESWTWNLERIAQAKNMRVENLTVIILERPRHTELIEEVRAAGARIRLITDGDVSAAIATCRKDSTGIDALFGTGGAPEGVIAAAALRCVNGDMQGRLRFRNDEERARARKMGITDESRVYSLEDLASGNVMFAATGVTQGSFLEGVKFFAGGARTNSIVMRSESGTVRNIDATHNFETKPAYSWLHGIN
jgi:fructose-1,6-bisphosphatase II